MVVIHVAIVSKLGPSVAAGKQNGAARVPAFDLFHRHRRRPNMVSGRPTDTDIRLVVVARPGRIV